MFEIFVSYNVPIFRYFVTLCWVWYSYHSYVREVTWCEIFWWFYRSPSSSLGHSSCFSRQVWPPFYGSDCCPCILGVLGIDYSCTCHSFSVGWLFYSSKCSNTCWDWHFAILYGIMRCSNHVTLGCQISCPTLWKPSGSVLPPVVGFFGKSLTQLGVCFVSSRRSFGYHTNMFLVMCESKSRHLVISLSYHDNISFIISPFSYNIIYMSWLVTFIVAHLSWC